ncbi:MAG: hypothetical protein MJ152_05065 [Clostridia bacterium]|nr:hypothetical protein [Clostridia bacterium]
MLALEILLYNNPYPIYARNTADYKENDKVVVELNGSMELGLIKGSYDVPNVELADIIRKATKEDDLARCENCHESRKMLPEIKKEAQKLGLDMKIGFISISLDKSKITVNYTADERVDFRELIKVLSNKYKSRIEMKQIGNRDETKQVGALGVCGRETCCKAFLSDFDKVSIKMAKNQNLALNPNKINGMCGRLLCCLKYEDDFYSEMQNKMPRVGFKVGTPDGVGVVSNVDFLKEMVSVTFTKDETTEVKVYELKDIKFNSKDKERD